MNRCLEPKKIKASVGDVIQYRYGNGLNLLTTNRILEVINEGESFVVSGFFNVKAADVTTVIPMHEAKVDCGDPVCIDVGRCVCEKSW